MKHKNNMIVHRVPPDKYFVFKDTNPSVKQLFYVPIGSWFICDDIVARINL